MIKTLTLARKNLRRENRRCQRLDAKVIAIAVAERQKALAVIAKMRELVRDSKRDKFIQVAERGHLRRKRLTETRAKYKNTAITIRLHHTVNV